MITSRVLPHEEWDRVAAFAPFNEAGLPSGEAAQHWEILVVEDDGQIVACCSLSDQVHWDGFSVDAAHRGNPVVFRALLEQSLQTLIDAGVAGAHLTIPDDHPELAAMVERFGFIPAPGRLYLLAVPPRRSA